MKVEDQNLDNRMPELDHMVNQIGRFIEYWGFKSIEGKIWCHIYLSKNPLSPAQLMKRLGISKALASISIQKLVKNEVIRVAARGSYGTQLYEANPNILAVILKVIRSREAVMMADIMAATNNLREMKHEDMDVGNLSERRIEHLHQVVSDAKNFLDTMILSKSEEVQGLSFTNAPSTEEEEIPLQTNEEHT